MSTAVQVLIGAAIFYVGFVVGHFDGLRCGCRAKPWRQK